MDLFGDTFIWYLLTGTLPILWCVSPQRISREPPSWNTAIVWRMQLPMPGVARICASQTTQFGYFATENNRSQKLLASNLPFCMVVFPFLAYVFFGLTVFTWNPCVLDLGFKEPWTRRFDFSHKTSIRFFISNCPNWEILDEKLDWQLGVSPLFQGSKTF